MGADLIGKKVRHGNLVGRVLSVSATTVLIDTGNGVVPVSIPEHLREYLTV